MFFIYSLSLENFAVRLYDCCRTKDGIDDLLDTVAKNFLRHEEGERRAESPYRDDITDDKITEDGYFLRHSAEKPQQIDVFQRKTQILTGRVWNSYDVDCKKVMHFAVTEAALGLPVECTGKGVITQTFNTAREAQFQLDHMEKLKERLATQREKLEEQLAQQQPVEEYQISDIQEESDDESSELYHNPLTILQMRVDAEQSVIEKDIWDEKIEDAKNLLADLSGINKNLKEPFKLSYDEKLFVKQFIPTPPPLPPKELIIPEIPEEWTSFQGFVPPPPPPPPLRLPQVVKSWSCPANYDYPDVSDTSDDTSDDLSYSE